MCTGGRIDRTELIPSGHDTPAAQMPSFRRGYDGVQAGWVGVGCEIDLTSGAARVPMRCLYIGGGVRGDLGNKDTLIAAPVHPRAFDDLRGANPRNDRARHGRDG